MFRIAARPSLMMPAAIIPRTEFDDAGGDYSKDRRLENIEGVIDWRQLAVLNVQPAQNNHHDRARQDKRETRQDSSP